MGNWELDLDIKVTFIQKQFSPSLGYLHSLNFLVPLLSMHDVWSKSAHVVGWNISYRNQGLSELDIILLLILQPVVHFRCTF